MESIKSGRAGSWKQLRNGHRRVDPSKGTLGILSCSITWAVEGKITDDRCSEKVCIRETSREQNDLVLGVTQLLGV